MVDQGAGTTRFLLEMKAEEEAEEETEKTEVRKNNIESPKHNKWSEEKIEIGRTHTQEKH